MRPPRCRYLNYEGEIAIVIGERCKHIAPEEADDYILGYTVANDYGLHDFRDTDAGSMLRVKGSDTLCPLGPGLVTDWDFRAKAIQTRVNGDVKQDGNTDEMIWDMRYLVADIARTITLLPNDVILSGTPANSRPVEPGDVVEVEVEGLGILRTFIVEGDVPVRRGRRRAALGVRRGHLDRVRRGLGVPRRQSPEAEVESRDPPERSPMRAAPDAASDTFRGPHEGGRDMDLSGRRLRLLIPDILGLERGKYLFGDVAEAGHAAFCIGLYPLTTDREILPTDRQHFDVGLPDVEAQLDRDTPSPGMGRRHHGRYRRRGAARPSSGARPAARPEAGDPGLARHGPGATAGVRARVLSVRAGRGRRMGPGGPAVAPRLRHGDVGGPDRAPCTTWSRPRSRPASTWRAGAASSTLPPIEVNWRYRDGIAAADEAFLFRVLVREIAARHGRHATFLGRPFNDRGGSGMHMNLSFRRRDGSNAFHDPDDPDGLSELARRSIAGLLTHHRGMSAICAPTVNAYKRLKPDMLNGYLANWGLDDRTVGVRVPSARGEGSRIEHRMADAAANPYLTGAALLHAARIGVVEELELGPRQEPGAEPNTDVAVPNTLSEALDELQSDTKLCPGMTTRSRVAISSNCSWIISRWVSEATTRGAPRCMKSIG